MILPPLVFPGQTFRRGIRERERKMRVNFWIVEREGDIWEKEKKIE